MFVNLCEPFVSLLIVCDGGRWWWCGGWCGVEGWRAGGYDTLDITLMVLG